MSKFGKKLSSQYYDRKTQLAVPPARIMPKYHKSEDSVSEETAPLITLASSTHSLYSLLPSTSFPSPVPSTLQLSRSGRLIE